MNTYKTHQFTNNLIAFHEDIQNFFNGSFLLRSLSIFTTEIFYRHVLIIANLVYDEHFFDPSHEI